MTNRFYTGFDWETIGGRGEGDYRTPFQVDRDRIIYTHAFRRLQAKTQVFLAGEHDFYRTRLTHSIEVAQIGRSICAHLRHLGAPLAADFHVDADLVEAACLAHDLGHPPFGHAGERALNRLMRPHGGFEGNAQTLRILPETIYSDNTRRRGMKPTRALLDGVLKYKRFWSELPEEARDRHFLYDDQADLVRFVAGTPPGAPVDCSRSVECQIMDWADDTAYSLNDIVDGVHAGLLTVGRLEQWGAASAVAGRDGHLLEEILDAVRAGRIDSRFGRKTGAFLQACRLVVRPGAGAAAGGRTYRHAFDLEVEPETRAEADLYCRIARDLVFYSPQLRHLEHKSDYILRRIFRLLEERYLHGMPDAIDLLPVPLSRQLREEPAECVRARLLCDHLAGLTDASATRTYKRLFDPDFGSWLEPV